MDVRHMAPRSTGMTDPRDEQPPMTVTMSAHAERRIYQDRDLSGHSGEAGARA
jgi:hypothetical protein